MVQFHNLIELLIIYRLIRQHSNVDQPPEHFVVGLPIYVVAQLLLRIFNKIAPQNKTSLLDKHDVLIDSFANNICMEHNISSIAKWMYLIYLHCLFYLDDCEFIAYLFYCEIIPMGRSIGELVLNVSQINPLMR